MPRLIAYPDVLAQASADGLKCVYPGGCAFAHAHHPGESHVVGWGPDDPTVRASYRALLLDVPPDRLAALVARAWGVLSLAGQAWVAPVHHWASELEHGNDEAGKTVEPLLRELGIDPAPLAAASRAEAIAFAPGERAAFESFLAGLLPLLWKSDFTLLLPGTGAFATLHHHRQIWWRTPAADVAATLRDMAAT